MAQATTARFGKFRVMLGDSGSPITYVAPCGFTSKSLTFNRELTDVQIPDCDDPDKVAWLGRDAQSLSATISGEGVLASESVDIWLAALEGAGSVPIKLEIEFPAKTITWTGAAQLTSFNPSGELGGRVTASIEMSSDGELVRSTSNNALAPQNIGLPQITGTPQVTQVLTCSNGAWLGYPTPVYTRQWRADGVAISGATNNTYTVTSGHVGKKITCDVTATNASGTKTVTAPPTSTVLA